MTAEYPRLVLHEWLPSFLVKESPGRGILKEEMPPQAPKQLAQKQMDGAAAHLPLFECACIFSQVNSGDWRSEIDTLFAGTLVNGPEVGESDERPSAI